MPVHSARLCYVRRSPPICDGCVSLAEQRDTIVSMPPLGWPARTSAADQEIRLTRRSAKAGVLACSYGRITGLPKRSLFSAGYQEVESVLWRSGTKDLLDHIHYFGSGGRFRSAAVVGTGCDHPHLLLELVGGLSQRLVLVSAATRRFYLVVSSGCRAVFRRRHRCFCRGIRRHHRHGLLWDALH